MRGEEAVVCFERSASPSAIRNGAKSMNRPYAFPVNESAAKEVRRRFIRQLVPQRNAVISTRTSASSLRRGVVSVTFAVAAMLIDCDSRKMSRWMTSQHSS